MIMYRSISTILGGDQAGFYIPLASFSITDTSAGQNSYSWSLSGETHLMFLCTDGVGLPFFNDAVKNINSISLSGYE